MSKKKPESTSFRTLDLWFEYYEAFLFVIRVMIPLDVAGSSAGDGFLLAWQPGEHLHRSAAQWDRRCRIRDPVLKNSLSQVTHFKYWAIFIVLEISLLRMRFKI